MDNSILIALIAAGVAFLTAIGSLIVGLKSLNLQRKLKNADNQIDYLKNKLSLLEKAKSELISLDHYELKEMTNRETLVMALGEYTDSILKNLPKIIENLKGHIDNSVLSECEYKINKFNEFKINKKANEILNKENDQSSYDREIINDPINFVIKTKNEFKEFLTIEMLNYQSKIERIISINSR
jgi:hypothetical protein